MWWPWKKQAERALIETFETGLRLIQVPLFSTLTSQYAATMEKGSANVLAAQVVNYLKGEDIEAVMQNSAEPLRTRIAEVKDQVPNAAANAMLQSLKTREAIVATLRMRAVLEFMLQGEAYVHSEQYQRIYGLLVAYGPEFPEEIQPERYLKIAHDYRQALGH